MVGSQPTVLHATIRANGVNLCFVTDSSSAITSAPAPSQTPLKIIN